MRTNLSLMATIVLSILTSFGQGKNNKDVAPQAPRLVVAVVVDQMSYDDIAKNWAAFGQGGFKRLVNQGF